MKLSKKKWLFLGIGIFVILGAGLGMLWTQRVQEQRQLKQELSLAQLRLKKSEDVRQPSPQQVALQDRLTQLGSQLTVTKSSLSQLIETIEVNETLFDIAETSGVEITQINSAVLTDIKLDKIPCSALRSNLQIEGDTGNILDFIYKWTEKFPTGVVVSVQITDQSEGAEPTISTSANIELLIYSYSGD